MFLLRNYGTLYSPLAGWLRADIIIFTIMYICFFETKLLQFFVNFILFSFCFLIGIFCVVF